MRLLTWDEIVKIHDLVCPETKGIRYVITNKIGNNEYLDNFSYAKIIAKRHPFFDGNKRTSMMILWIEEAFLTYLDAWTIDEFDFEKIIKNVIITKHKKELDLLSHV